LNKNRFFLGWATLNKYEKGKRDVLSDFKEKHLLRVAYPKKTLHSTYLSAPIDTFYPFHYITGNEKYHSAMCHKRLLKKKTRLNNLVSSESTC